MSPRYFATAFPERRIHCGGIPCRVFNLDAILKDKDLQAITDQYKPEWNQLNRAGNDGVADIAITKGGESIHIAQSKYGANAETTAGRGETGFSQVKDGKVKYGEADTI